ncbi:MAG TPA: chemotaxis protein CheW [Bryobacteraceae bacterium]|nr:chemotaxis protein CheW [Bryobacteraceae bacterium]
MPTETGRGVQDVLIFRTSNHRCAILASRISELVLMPALIRLPAQPAILDGFLNLRGKAVPVVPLDRLFESDAPAPALYAPLVVIETSEGPLALRVEAVEEVVAVDLESMVSATASDSLNGCAEAQFQWLEQAVAMLSTEQLLLKKEETCVAALQAQAQARLESLESGRP